MYPAVLLGGVLLYGLTCQRGVGWQDSGMFQFRIAAFDLTGRLGLALAHPLYIAAGWLMKFVPLGELPTRLNFFSALGMAVALANLAAICTILTGKRWIGAAAAAMLAVTHTCWWLATIAEVYTFSAAGLTGELWLLVMLIRRPTWGKLAALALVSGLGLCIHNFALLPMPVYLAVAIVLIVRKQLPLRSLPIAAAAWLVGAGLYIAMTFNLAVGGAGPAEAVRSALFGNYSRQVLNVADASKHWKANAAISAMNFVNFLAPLAIIGWFRMRRRVGTGLAAAIGAITVVEVLFFIRYPVPDQFTFLLPSLVMLAVAAAVGVAVLADASRRLRVIAVAACALSVLIPPIIYAAAPAAARAAEKGPPRKRQLPYRDELRYWLVPWKHNEQSAERFVQAVLEDVEPDAVIVAASTSCYPLAAARKIYGLREDITLLGGHEPWPVPNPADDLEAFFSAVGNRPLYTASNVPGYCPDALLPYVDAQPVGALYRINRGKRPCPPKSQTRSASGLQPTGT